VQSVRPWRRQPRFIVIMVFAMMAALSFLGLCYFDLSFGLRYFRMPWNLPGLRFMQRTSFTAHNDGGPLFLFSVGRRGAGRWARGAVSFLQRLSLFLYDCRLRPFILLDVVKVAAQRHFALWCGIEADTCVNATILNYLFCMYSVLRHLHALDLLDRRLLNFNNFSLYNNWLLRF